MPDLFDSTGLQVKSLTELRTQITNGLLAIFPDANLAPDTQDGQTIGIIAQFARDTRELLLRVNSGIDPDQAAGRILDQRLALNNIKRNGGTYTFAPVEITTTGAVTLVGLDTQIGELEPSVANLYTVRDDEGNQFFLAATTNIATAGVHSLSFRAQRIGRTEVAPNSISTPVTINGAVSGVNNPAGPSSVGIDEESDAAAKVRRRSSTSIAAQAIIDAIEARIADLTGVEFVRVTENNDNSAPDADGTPANTIWIIVDGGADSEIADIIYRTKSPGVGMRGDTVVNVTRPGTPARQYPTRFDRPIEQDLYIRFSLALPGGNFDADEIKSSIVNNVFWTVGQRGTGDVITTYLKGLNSFYEITNMELSINGTTYTETVDPTSARHRFVNSAARISIV